MDTLSIGTIWKEMVTKMNSLGSNLKSNKTLLSGAIFDGTVTITKDYVQVILVLSFIGAIAIGDDHDRILEVALAIIYGTMYLISAYGSRVVYKVMKYAPATQWMNRSLALMVILLLLIGLSLRGELYIIATVGVVGLFIVKNIRRPIFVDVISGAIKKDERTTALSVESFLKSIFIVTMAPAFGWVADYSLVAAFITIGVVVFFLYFTIKIPHSTPVLNK